jgi:hypothetical protein
MLKLIEEWRAVPGYSSKYEVSSFWRVRSSHGVQKILLKPELLGKDPALYLAVCLSRNGRSRKRLVHQLVLEAFVGPRPAGAVARHLDGNRLNCAPTNLAWGTRTENLADRRKHGRGNGGERNPRAKLTQADVDLRHPLTFRLLCS